MIRPAPIDAEALSALHGACFTLPRPWSAAEIAGLLESSHVTLLTESGGFLVGRCVAGEAEVLTVAVEPGLRRQGIGGRLLSGFLAEARTRQAQTVFLEVAAGNGSAIALYHKAGFAEVGRRKAYYSGPDGQRDDALILSRAL